MIEQQWGNVHYLQFSHYLQFPEIIHGIFTRDGGFSEVPFWSLNASCSTGDCLDNVVRNRLLVLQSMGIQNYPCATLWVIHSAYVLTVEGDTWSDWRYDWPFGSSYLEQQELVWSFSPLRLGDALITQQFGVALVLSYADCVPLLFYDPVAKVVGLAHAGWRGTARGVAVATVEAMCRYFGCQPRDIHVGIGPSIGPCCNEVSRNVQSIFNGEEQFSDIPTSRKYLKLVKKSAVFEKIQKDDRDRLSLDLWETNRNQLLMAGLLSESIESSNICTCCNTELFFSHRGERGKTGRFPVVLALRNPIAL